MSLLLKDRVYTMLAPTAKRGVYPLHSYKLGLYRIPVKLEDPAEIESVVAGLKKTFAMDTFADRIYATYKWKTNNDEDPQSDDYQETELNVTVEVVTGEVVDIIYQILPIERFGDPYWIKGYRKQVDANAKMVIDTILRNTILSDKLLDYFVKTKKMSEEEAQKELENMTPLAKVVPNAKPKPKAKAESQEQQTQQQEKEEEQPEVPDGAKPGPIDVEFKSKMKQTEDYVVPETEYKIKTWGRKKGDNQVLGVWGDYVAVDFDICVADGACIDACPVNVYEWMDTPGNPASDKKPLMAREPDCIFCLACEGVCPPQAIKIFQKKE